MNRTRLISAATLLLLSVAGCSDVLVPGDGEVDRIDLEPGAISLEEGDATQVQALLRGTDGGSLAGRQVFWAAEDSTIARVSSTGMVTAVRTGRTRIAASAEGKSGVATVDVRVAAVASVAVSPAESVLQTGGSVTLAAALRDARGRPLSGRAVAWSSSEPRVATVEADGTVRAVRPGSVTISAVSEGVTGTAAVSVRAGPPVRLDIASGSGQSATVATLLPQPLSVRVLSEAGDPVAGTPVTWAVEGGGGSLDPTTATSGPDGIATTRWTLGTGTGEHRARASVGGAGAAFTAQAVAGPLRTLRVQPDSFQFAALRDTARARVSGTDAFGNPVALTSVTWASLDASVATVDGGGLVDGRANGTTGIVARVGSVADTVKATVQQRAASVALAPGAATINAIGYRTQLAPTVRDANGHVIPNAAVSWSSGSESIATVDGRGEVTGRGVGTVSIRATSGSATGTATVTVRQVVASVTTAPQQVSVPVGATAQITATAADSGGTTVPNVAFTWSSSAAGIASVEGPGLVRGVAPGTATVRAAAGSVSGSSTVQVTAASNPPPPPPVVTRVVVDPASASLGRSSTCQLTATAYDASGRVVSGQTFTWQSSSPGSATVDQNGVVTHVAAGNTTITATTAGVAGTSQISVNNGQGGCRPD